MLRTRFLIALAFVLASFLSLSAWAADVGGYAAHGTVESVDASAGTVTIDHEDIPGLMMGMTMKFSVSDAEILRGVAPGQVVDFRVRKDGDRYVVTEIRPSPKTSDSHEMKMEKCGCCGGAMGMAPERPPRASDTVLTS